MCPASLPCPPVLHMVVRPLWIPQCLLPPVLQHMRGVTNGSSVGQRGSAATRVCSREVEARSGAWPSNRVQVCWTQVCANGRSHTRCKAINSGLGPMRAAHMARSAIVFRRSDTFSNAIDDGAGFRHPSTTWTFSHVRPSGKQPTRIKERLRIPRIRTVLVRLNPDLAKSATKRSRWLPCGPRDPLSSPGEETTVELKVS